MGLQPLRVPPSGWVNNSVAWRGACSAPTFSLAAGSYTGTQTVTITSSPGTSIYYTTDGSTPTFGSPPTMPIVGLGIAAFSRLVDRSLLDGGSGPVIKSMTSDFAFRVYSAPAPAVVGTLYSTPVSVAATETVKALAARPGWGTSAVISAAYTINAATTATPTFSPVAGTYSVTQSVVISCSTAGSVIHYTTDGSTPTAGSTTYSTAISVTATETLQAIAITSGYSDSAIGSALYTISAVTARFFASTSLWNTVKTNPPATWYAAADTTLSGATYGINDGAFSHPTYFGQASDSTVTFTCGVGWGNPAQTVTAKAPSGMSPASGSDHVMQVYLGAGGSGTSSGALPAGTLLDLYGVTGSGTSFTALFYGLSDGDAGSGFSPSTIASMTASGTCAIGSPQAGGTILARDVTAGVISHGLFMAFDATAEGGYGSSPKPTGPLAPAISFDDSGGSGLLTQGMLLLIPSGTSKPTFTSAMGGALWDACATYGVYISDRLTGGPMFYGDRSVASSFNSGDYNSVGRALRVVKTW